MTYNEHMQILTAKWTRRGYELLLTKQPADLTSSEKTLCLQCIKYMLENRREDTALPGIVCKFGIEIETE